METSYLPNGKCKTMFMRMLKELGKRMHEISEKLKKK